jgi:hypothetical protein
MPFLRALIPTAAAAAAALTLAAPADAGNLDACAQRVIRDWYSGGRVDGTYPLSCYRAAIRALPEDVLQYSNADKDIARALAYAQRGRPDPGNAASAPAPAARPGTPPSSTSTTRRTATPATAKGSRTPPSLQTPRPRASARRFDGSVRLASGPDAEPAGAGLPYPVLALATLAVLLLVSAAAAALAARRR